MSYEDDDTRCDWEEQGFGSAPYIAAEKLAGDLLIQHYIAESWGEKGP
jgi:hypothetical protein